MRKPRLRRGSEEVELESYSALQSFDLLCENIMKHAVHEVSTRSYDSLLSEISGGTGLKKSSVSKAFVKGSKEQLDQMNSRDLTQEDYCSLMIDGVGFGDRTVIVVPGITAEGKKQILGLREGETEN